MALRTCPTSLLQRAMSPTPSNSAISVISASSARKPRSSLIPQLSISPSPSPETQRYRDLRNHLQTPEPQLTARAPQDCQFGL